MLLHRSSFLSFLFSLLLGIFALSADFSLVTTVTGAESAPVRDKHVEARLLTDVDAIEPGVPFTLALRFDLDPTWHTYWTNPGEAGLIPSLKLDLPEGFEVGPLQFPVPKKFIIDYGAGIREAGFGYETTVIHPLTITPPASLTPGQKLLIQGKASWLMCDPNTCVPGKANLSLELGVADKATPSAETATIQAARDAIPIPSPDPISLAIDGQNVKISAKIAGKELPADAKFAFYPLVNHVFDPFIYPEVSVSGDAVTITGKKHASLEKAEDLPKMYSGVLSVTTPDRVIGFEISTTGKTESSAGTAPKSASNPDSANVSDLPFGGGLLGALLAAFLGGIILNIMPCVFPVISLKVMSFVGQAGESRKRVLAHSLVFALGILVFFWVLTGVMLILKNAGGADLGWGVQLRQPGFVLTLIFIMVGVALSLFGVIEIGSSMTTVGGNLTYQSGYAGSFWSGALAVLLATPCTAPFMAPAIGFALVQPAPMMFLIFTAMGLGLAAPYFIFALFPKLLKAIPAPGPWMESFKQFMGFPMLAVAVWLIGVLSKQLSVAGLQWALASVLIGAFGVWVLGRFGAPGRSERSKKIATGVTALIAGTALWLAWDSTTKAAPPSSVKVSDTIAQLRAEGKNVFVDFTAEWCITCKVNERVAIKTEAVQAAFREHNIEFVIADWTNQDDDIAAILKEHGRAGVPMYLLYPADTKREAIQLKDGFILPSDVMEAIEKL